MSYPSNAWEPHIFGFWPTGIIHLGKELSRTKSYSTPQTVRQKPVGTTITPSPMAKRKHAGSSSSSKRRKTSGRRRRSSRRRSYSRRRRRGSKLVGYRATRMLGQQVGSAKCKQAEVLNANAVGTFNLRTLYDAEMLAISHGDGPGQRLTNKVNFRGFQIWLGVKNRSSQSVCVHIAIISPRDSDTPTSTDFFRNYGANRGQDFSGLSNVEYNTLAINTDKNLVLKKFKFRLAGATESSTSEEAGDELSYRQFHWYEPINRQLRFSSTSATTPETGKIFFCMWLARPMDSGTTASANQVYRDLRVVNCFREPKN